MAKQRGFLKIEGSLGDTTFLKTKNGYLAKEKSVISASKIQNDPNFQRTRENMSEFGRACKAGKLLRNGTDALSKVAKDQTSIGRLVNTMMQLIHSDLTSLRGQRKASKGNAHLLEGFNFNEAANFTTCFHAPVTGTIDRVSGALSVNIASFIPGVMVSAPKGATHFKIVTAGVELDFDNHAVNSDINESVLLPLDYTATPILNIINIVPANSINTLCLVVGIQYSERLNGVQYPLNNSSYNSLFVLKTS